MKFPSLISAPGAPTGALIDRRLPWALLGLHAVVWTLAAWLSRANLDVPGDMVENYVWGLEWQAGYHSHPPLFAWATGIWFEVFPRTHLAYFALSSLNALVGLLGVRALALCFVPAPVATLAALTLAVSPFYTALAIKFNANAIQIAIWPWAAVFLVQSMQRRNALQLVLCGAVCALALLGKYFSGILCVTLLIVAIAIPEWRRQLRPLHVILALVAGIVVLLPHLAWMAAHQFSTLQFAQARSAGEAGPAARRLLTFTVAQMGYLLPSTLLLLWHVEQGQRLQALAVLRRSLIRPRGDPLWYLTWTPLLLIAAIALIRHTEMAAVWGMPIWFAFTTWWLRQLEREGVRLNVSRLPRAMGVVWLAVMALSLLVGILQARRGAEDAAAPRAELARAAEAYWQQQMGTPLPSVTGSTNESRSVAFYARSRVRWWDIDHPDNSPWLTAAQVRDAGTLVICVANDSSCEASARRLGAQGPQRVTPERRVWTYTQAPEEFHLYLLAPASREPSAIHD